MLSHKSLSWRWSESYERCLVNPVLNGDSPFLPAQWVGEMAAELRTRGITLAGQRLLIIGPGQNPEAHYWLAAFPELAGIIQVDWMADHVRAQQVLFAGEPKVQTFCSSASDLSEIETGSIAGIFSFLSLFYLERDVRAKQKAAAEMHRVLRVDGGQCGWALLHVYYDFYDDGMDGFCEQEKVLFAGGLQGARLWFRGDHS